MAEGIKISEMDEMTALTENCYAPIIIEGANRKINLLNMIYPIGSIYLTVNNVNPSNIFGGTWEKLENRFLVGAGSDFAAGTTGGSKTSSISATSLEYIWYTQGSSGADIKGAKAQSFSIVPPYLSVYMWKRIA